MPEIQSGEEWREQLCRWLAPVWLRKAASRHFTNDTSAWDDPGEQSALQRLDKEETEKLLDRICRWFWSAVEATLENKARLASIDLASQAEVGPATGGSKGEVAEQTVEKQKSADAPELAKGAREGQTVDLLHGQLKKIRKLYREKGWSPSQIRKNTAQDLAVVWEWIDRISEGSRKSEFLRVSDWDDGDGFIFRQIATLYEYAPHLSKKPSWSTVRDWRKAFRGHVRYKTPDGRKPRS